MSTMSVSKNKDAIAERRLRPIYDWIDAGVNKKAVQEADRLIKKHPDIHAAKALKALALIRLQRYADATGIIDALEQQHITDDGTLQALTHCFKELHKPERICRLYEAACKLVPNSDELLSHLFMSYVRTLDYRKQFATATQLFREYPRSTYGYWGAMSALMQAITNPDMAKISLPLAHRMVKKSIECNEPAAACTPAEVHMQLMVYDMQQDWQAALDLLEGPLIASSGLDKTMWDREYRVLELNQKLQRHELVVERCAAKLLTNRDDWRLYSLMFTSAFDLLQQTPSGKSDLISVVTDCILGCLQPIAGQPRPRGPYLARLRWMSGLLEHDLVMRADLGQCRLGEPMQLLVEYIELFGDRACCCADIRPYLCLLGEQQQQELQFLSNLPQPSVSPADSLGSINRWSCHQQLSVCLRSSSTSPAGQHDKLQSATNCLRLYLHNLHLHKTENSSDFAPADSFVVVCAQLLWDVYVESGDIQVLLELALLLECALRTSSTNHQLTVILVKIYVLLGASERALQLCTETLGIKNVQLDSLGYLVFDTLRPFGCFQSAGQQMHKVSSYFTNTGRDLIDGLVTAYYRGSFAQIPEMLSYHDQCTASLHRYGAHILGPFLHLITLCQSADAAPLLIRAATSSDRVQVELNGEPVGVEPVPVAPIEWNKLKDNRDFGILPDWEPGAEDQLTERSKHSAQQMIDVLRYHYLLIRGLALVGGTGGLTVEQSRAQLRTLRIQLKAHHKHCQLQYANGQLPRLRDAACVQWSLYVQGGYFELIECVLDCAYFLMCQSSPNSASSTTTDDWLADSGHVSSATPSSTSFSSDAASDVDETSSVLSELSLRSDTGLAGITGTAGSGSRSASQASTSNGSSSGREHSPERLTALPTTDDIQALCRRIVANHQLPVGQANGHVTNSQSASSSSWFGYLQLCHLSYLTQTIGVVLITCALMRQPQQSMSAALAQLPVDASCRDGGGPASESGSSVKSSGRSSRKSGSGKQPKSGGNKKEQQQPAATTTTAAATTLYNCPAGLMQQMDELCSVLCQLPHTIERLLNDLKWMLEDAPLKPDTQRLIDMVPEAAETLPLGEVQEEVSGWLRSSYASAIAQMHTVVGTHKMLAESLMTSTIKK